jgi:hypothetical protein
LQLLGTGAGGALAVYGAVGETARSVAQAAASSLPAIGFGLAFGGVVLLALSRGRR